MLRSKEIDSYWTLQSFSFMLIMCIKDQSLSFLQVENCGQKSFGEIHKWVIFDNLRGDNIWKVWSITYFLVVVKRLGLEWCLDMFRFLIFVSSDEENYQDNN